MSTYTTSKTFTITHARYITSKVAADLRQLRLFYGRPDDDQIDAYAEEAALLLRDGYLERVDYGFRRQAANLGPQWVLLLRYVVKDGVLDDDRSGRVPPGVDVSGTSFWSERRPTRTRVTRSQQLYVGCRWSRWTPAAHVARGGVVDDGEARGHRAAPSLGTDARGGRPAGSLERRVGWRLRA